MMAYNIYPSIDGEFDFPDVVKERLLSEVNAKNTQQDNRLGNVESKNTAQDGRLDDLDSSVEDILLKNNSQDSRLDNVESKNTAQDTRLGNVESKNTTQDTRLGNVESENAQQDTRLDNVESKNTAQDGRLGNVESKNTAQDGRLDDLDSSVEDILLKNNSQDSLITKLLESTQVLNAPPGFNADTVGDQKIYMVTGLDNASNMPGPGSWLLSTYPGSDDLETLFQIGLRYAISTPELWVRVKTSGGWGGWGRLDANDIRPVKTARLESGKWIWDTQTGTHYIIQDHTGALVVRETVWPTPNSTIPEFNW